jgi:hypothetical protein
MLEDQRNIVELGFYKKIEISKKEKNHMLRY